MLELTQAEAELLLGVEKRRINDDQHRFGATRLEIPLLSADRRESFCLDFWRGRINLVRGKFQTRGRQTVVLARIDFGGVPHRNPDGQEIASPHLHLYREGYADKWAQPLPARNFTNTSDAWALLNDFLTFCNVTLPPLFERELFE